MDPRRADPLRHPAVRLYGEYILGYLTAIRRAPMSSADRRECYRHLAWMDDEPGPVREPRIAYRSPSRPGPSTPIVSVDTLVAGQERIVLMTSRGFTGSARS